MLRDFLEKIPQHAVGNLGALGHFIIRYETTRIGKLSRVPN
jgi:hypothetical protein